jgi:transposase
VWMAPEWIARMRRRLARRQQLVRTRSRAKNEIHAVLMRQLKGRPPASDLFGVKGRQWLRSLKLPAEESETVEAGLRHIEFLDQEIAQVERLIAKEALESPQVRRLLSVPGVNVICAATFLAAVGDIRRFKDSRKLVACLGLDPRVYQSGSAPARGGRISKQGSSSKLALRASMARRPACGPPTGACAEAERKLAEQAETSYKRSIADRQAARPNRPRQETGASVTAGRA